MAVVLIVSDLTFIKEICGLTISKKVVFVPKFLLFLEQLCYFQDQPKKDVYGIYNGLLCDYSKGAPISDFIWRIGDLLIDRECCSPLQ